MKQIYPICDDKREQGRIRLQQQIQRTVKKSMVRLAISPLSLSLRGARGSLKPVGEMAPIFAASAVVMRQVLRGAVCLESKVNSMVSRVSVGLDL